MGDSLSIMMAKPFALVYLWYTRSAWRGSHGDNIERLMKHSDSFGSWVRRRRKALDLTQSELAQLVGCALQTVKKIEADERRPSRQMAERLAQHLQVAPDERPAFLRVALAEQGVYALPSAEQEGVRLTPLPRLGPDALPAPPTPLIGRESMLVEVATLLRRRSARLITLVGPPGIGKTRLSIAAARRARTAFPDGVWFVALAALTASEQVLEAVAGALGVRESEHEPLEKSLHSALRDRRMLLVLDNFEHLIPAAPLVADLLAACPALTLLVTSREVLRLRAEHVYHVTPLALPHGGPDQPPAAALRAPAVRLFLERARAANHSFTVTSADVPALAEICRRLDGLPLAIELAAAQAGLLGPCELLSRLERRLDLLADGPRDLPPRQQTLRGAIAWSYDLLTPDERRAFAWLGVFTGSYTADAACALVAPGEWRRGMALLNALAQKSLLQREQPGAETQRFSMLESISEYALEQLRGLGEEELARERHAAYYLDLATQAERAQHLPSRGDWLSRLEAEYENLRAALAWGLGDPSISPGERAATLGQARAAAGVRLAAALGWFWPARGHLREGRQRVQDALALAAHVAPGIRPKLLAALGGLALYQDDLPTAVAATEEALALFQALGDRPAEAWTGYQLGLVLSERGESAAAEERYLASLALFRELGDQVGVAAALRDLGRIYVGRREFAAARAAFAESIELLRRLGDTPGIAWTLLGMAQAAADEGDAAGARRYADESAALFEVGADEHGLGWARHLQAVAAIKGGDCAAALRYAEEGLALFRKHENLSGIAWTQLCLAQAHIEQGRAQEGRACCREALELAARVGWLDALTFALEMLAGVAVAEGRARRAARLLGAAAALRERHDKHRPPSDRGWYGRIIGAVRRELGGEALAEEWASGQALTAEEAAALGLEG